MSDPYLYEEIPVLKNKLDIRVEETLALVEAELSRANMMLLYEQGFHDFSPDGLRFIHQELFGDIYDWAGQYRIINIEKLSPGRSFLIWTLCSRSHISSPDFGRCIRSAKEIPVPLSCS